MLRKLITPHMDFLILTETKAHPTALARIKLRYGMKISHHSSHQQARKGVIIIARPEHTIIQYGLIRKLTAQGVQKVPLVTDVPRRKTWNTYSTDPRTTLQ
jgi:exonuclease III